jgi:drug/metabolite transporter (DMT)-like permease
MFALSNVLIRKTAALAIEAKALAVFAGGIVMGTVCLLVLPAQPAAWLPSFESIGLLVLLAIVLFAVNLAVQHGLTHISANRAIVIYLFELVVTAISAWLLADEVLTLREWCGGLMIIAAGLLSERLGPVVPAVPTVSAYSPTAAKPPG